MERGENGARREWSGEGGREGKEREEKKFGLLRSEGKQRYVY